MNAATLFRYTTEVLSFAFVDAKPPTPPPPPDQDVLAGEAERVLRIFGKSSATTLVLFGLGSGGLAATLAASLDNDERLLVCDLDPAGARALREAGRLDWWREDNDRVGLICDTSPWALVYLLCQSGVTALDSCMALNGEAGAETRTALQNLQRVFRQGRHKSAINGTPLGHFAMQAPSLTACAMLSPAEPDLDRFLGQFPDWVEELVILWDAEEVPPHAATAAASALCPVRHLAHPLGGDFAAQRNRLLDACAHADPDEAANAGSWLLMLDGDEEFSGDMWTMLPALCPLRDIEGYWFQRQTFYPDSRHWRMGYGLWPDLQLRLFKNRPGLRFAGAVHERLTGMRGRVALVLDAPILHRTFISKRPEEIRAKLQGFDAASGGGIRHQLSEDYPHLPVAMLHQAHLLWNEFQLLILPENPQ